MKTRRHSRPGFSLVETLVAMFIFMLAIGVLSEAMTNALMAISSLEINEGRERDIQFVRDQVLTISDTDSLGMGGDVATPDAGQAHWDLVESQTTDTPYLMDIKISISLSGNGDIPAETQTEEMYILRPQLADTDEVSAQFNDIDGALQNVRTQQAWP